ncbi:MAG: sulfite exporter TauE/SafE family protein, partial [Acidobacteriota bacterium]
GNTIKPFIGAYLLFMGLMILRKAFKKIKEKRVETKIIPLATAGGFFDAIGGGGWGPIVTSTLMARGHNPRFTIGSVNLSEFFVTVAEAATFFTILGLVHWQVIVGLLIGGVLAAPMAAYVCKRLPSRALMIIVGILITVLSIRTIYLALF